MNRILLSCLALGAMTSAAAAEPVPMTAAQMDGVTAGLAFADAFAGAFAFGSSGSLSQTDTRTTAVGTGIIDVGVAVGVANAIGTGEVSGAESESTAVASGELGIARTFDVGFDAPWLASFHSISIAVGVGSGY